MENNHLDIDIEKQDWKKKYLIPALCIAGYLITIYLLIELIVLCVDPLVQKALGLNSKYVSAWLSLDISFEEFPLDIQNFLATTSTYINFTTYLILFASLIAVFWRTIKNDFISLGETSHVIGKYIVYGVLAAYLFQIIANFVTLPFLENSVSENQQEIDLLFNSSLSNGLIMMLTTIVLGPVVEELIFRKCIFSFFKNDVLPIVLSSVIFGLIHTISSGYSFGQLILQTIPYAAAGVGFGLAYAKSNRNILVPIAGHMFLNCIACLLSLSVS